MFTVLKQILQNKTHPDTLDLHLNDKLTQGNDEITQGHDTTSQGHITSIQLHIMLCLCCVFVS